MTKAHKATAPQLKILLAALTGVAFDGWTPALEQYICKKLALSSQDFDKAFPDGMTGLVRYFSTWADDEMEKRLSQQDLPALRVRDKVTLGVRTRLEILSPYKEAVSSAMAFLALPPRCPLLAKLVWATADRIWWLSGDNATDYNHYSKRLLLSGVITSTTLYWLNDTSPKHEDTWHFLDRRVENVLKIGQKISNVKKKKAEKA